MKKLLLLVLVTLMTAPVFAQENGSKNDKNAPEPVFIVVEEQAEFPGGMPAMVQYLQGHIHYTTKAKKNNVEGVVYVSFVVEKDGGISNVRCVKGLDKGLDKVAVKAVRKMPRWTPAKQQGVPVRFQFTLPVQFRLQ